MPEYILFEPLDEAFHSLKPDNNKDEIEELYWTAQRRYREALKELHKLSHKDLPRHKFALIDKERNRLHKQIIKLGGMLGKTEREIFADLFKLTDSLAEYKLPEFKIISRDTFTELRLFDDTEELLDQQSSNMNKGHKNEPNTEKNDQGNEYQVVRDLAKDEFGVLFEREISAAVKIPDPAIIKTRGMLVEMDRLGTKERIRRAKRFAADHGFKLLKHVSFAHEYTERVYGIVADKASINKLVNLIRENREEYGIRISDMDENIIESDWQNYQNSVRERLRKMHGLGPFAQILYEHEWKRINEPGYNVSEGEIISEITGQGYGISDGEITKTTKNPELKQKKGMKAKDRRKLERARSKQDAEYPFSENNPFKIR